MVKGKKKGSMPNMFEEPQKSKGIKTSVISGKGKTWKTSWKGNKAKTSGKVKKTVTQKKVCVEACKPGKKSGCPIKGQGKPSGHVG